MEGYEYDKIGFTYKYKKKKFSHLTFRNTKARQDSKPNDVRNIISFLRHNRNLKWNWEYFTITPQLLRRDFKHRQELRRWELDLFVILYKLVSLSFPAKLFFLVIHSTRYALLNLRLNGNMCISGYKHLADSDRTLAAKGKQALMDLPMYVCRFLLWYKMTCCP